MSEAELEAAVVDLARLLGWRVAHFGAARTNGGWRTPARADAVGFPDLVLVRAPRLLAVELKSARGRLSSAQTGWLGDLGACDGVEALVWRPVDWLEGRVEAALR